MKILHYFRYDPELAVFSEMKSNAASSRGLASINDSTVSFVVGRKTLFLFNLDDPENPIELAFQGRYGNIVGYRWFGDGYILIGFTNGFLIVISTHPKEIGQELFQSKTHRDVLNDISISFTLSKAASIGDNCVKLYDLKDLQDTYAIINLEVESGSLHKLEWSGDGQLLSVATNKGEVFTYLTRLPVLGDTYRTSCAYLTSLLEVTVCDMTRPDNPTSFSVVTEPVFIALGQHHFAVGMNNRVWIYSLTETKSSEPLLEREYLGSVSEMYMNGDYAAVLFEKKIQLHMIEGDSDNDRDSRLFPDKDTDIDDDITCCSLTSDFLIFGTQRGNIHYFFIEDWKFVNEYRHTCTILKMFPDHSGTKLVFLDEKLDGYSYNPVNDELFKLPDLPSRVTGVIWDSCQSDNHVLVVFNEEVVVTYTLHRDIVTGEQVQCVGETKLPYGYRPLILYAGELKCQTQSGKLVNLALTSHAYFGNLNDLTPEEIYIYQAQLIDAFHNACMLKRYNEAWKLAELLNHTEHWLHLGKTLLNHLEVQMAMRVYRRIGDAAIVLSLQGLQHIEDRKLVAGHMALLCDQFDYSQQLFLESSQPLKALEMRRDLLQVCETFFSKTDQI